MFGNIFIIAVRNLIKNKVFSFLHIFGLAVGIAAFLLILHYVRFERSYEAFHRNAENIYRVTLDFYNGADYVITDSETQTGLGPLLKEKFPEVEDFARIRQAGNQDIRVGDVKFYEERVYLSDPSGLSVFTFPIIHGDSKGPLSAPMQAVLSTSMAKKYFGREDVAGESIIIGEELYKITAVMADVPPNTHLKINILLSNWEGYGKDQWNGNNDYTYLLVHPGTDLAAFNEKLLELCRTTMKAEVHENRWVAEPMRDIHLYSNNKTFEPEANGSARTVSFLLIVAILIIVIAWVNYINLSTARAVERAREIGIRKVMGSVRSQLMMQFLWESFMINMIAGFIAIVLIHLGLPLFRDIAGKPLPVFLLNDGQFWLMFYGTVWVGTLLAGLYPALVLSSFDPVVVLKGKFKSSSHGQWLRSGLVVLQFAASVVLLVCMATVFLQIRFLQNYDLGLRTDHTLVLRPPMVYDSIFELKYKSLEDKLKQYPFVQRTARSQSLPGLDLHELSTRSNIFKFGEEKEERGYRYYLYGFDEEFIPTFEMTLLAGRNFSGEAGKPEVIINERAMHTLGFKNPEDAVGGQITFGRKKESAHTVIGVLKNFNQRSPKEPHLPMIFTHQPVGSFTSIKIKTDDIRGAMDQVKAAWASVFPDFAFNYFFLDEKYDQQYNADRQFGQVVGIFSVLAMFIACLGLFGLSSFVVTQRTKEIGIRKVLGASVFQVVRLLGGDFVKLVVIASLVGIPVAFLAMNEWLSHYAVRIGLNGWLFAIPFAIILLITLVTVSFQTIRAAVTNPTESLKYE